MKVIDKIETLKDSFDEDQLLPEYNGTLAYEFEPEKYWDL